MPDLITDFIILTVPDSFDLDGPQAFATLDRMAEGQTLAQYGDHPPRAVLVNHIDWLVTSDWQEVERFQPDHDCVTCRAGNDQAIAFLKEFPDKRLALGNISYVEVW